MKRLICILILILVLPGTVFAENPPEIDAILDQPGIRSEEFLSMSGGQMIDRIRESIRSQIKLPFRLLAQILAGSVFSAAVLSLTPQKEWQNSMELICVMGMFTFSLKPALDLAGQIGTQVLEWRNYLVSFVPVFSGVMISCGQAGQAAVYSGMFLTMAAFASQLIATTAMPILQIYLAMNTASALCGVDGLSEGCGALAKLVKWILGFLSVLFSAVLALQSALAQTTDNLMLKTGRFFISSGIPIVGGAASEAMSSVLSGLKVLKGSLGFAAIAFLSIAFIPILLQSTGCCLAYSLGSAAAKTFGLKRAGQVLEGMGKAVGICISFLVFFFMLVVIATALMILSGGA